MAIVYTLDAQQSKFTVQAFATGMLAGLGHSPKFAIRQLDGEVRFAADNSSDSSVTINVKAGSLQLLDAVKEKERLEIQKTMMDEVLEVQRFPEIVFRSSQIAATKLSDVWFRLQITGELALHGVKKPLAIDGQLRLVDGDARLAGEFAISLLQYRLKQVTALGGLIRLKEDIKFVFDLLGRPGEQK